MLVQRHVQVQQGKLVVAYAEFDDSYASETCATGGLLLGDVGGDVRSVHGHLSSGARPSAQVGGEASADDERRVGRSAAGQQHGPAHRENATVDRRRRQQQPSSGVRRLGKSSQTFEQYIDLLIMTNLCLSYWRHVCKCEWARWPCAETYRSMSEVRSETFE